MCCGVLGGLVRSLSEFSGATALASSLESLGFDGEKRHLSAVSSPPNAKPSLSLHFWEPCGNQLTLPRKAVRSMERVEVRKSKRSFPFKSTGLDFASEKLARQEEIMSKQKTLYERVGGYEAIYKFAEDVIARLMDDEEVGHIWDHMSPI
jgi:hypothetical protein